MKKLITRTAIAAAMVAPLAALTACGSDGDGHAGKGWVNAGSSPTSAESNYGNSKRPIVEPYTLEEVSSVVRKNSSKMFTNEQVQQRSREICLLLDQGADPYDLMMEGRAVGIEPGDMGVLSAVAATAYCPEYYDRLERQMNAAGSSGYF